MRESERESVCERERDGLRAARERKEGVPNSLSLLCLLPSFFWKTAAEERQCLGAATAWTHTLPLPAKLQEFVCTFMFPENEISFGESSIPSSIHSLAECNFLEAPLNAGSAKKTYTRNAVEETGSLPARELHFSPFLPCVQHCQEAKDAR